MAFPSNYNINYYAGDTLEFKIYPKNSNGTAFDLTTYATTNSPPGNGALFTIATSRGSAGVSGRKTGTATISLSDNSITCVIPPSVGSTLTAGQSYFYDVEISKGSGDSLTVYTLLTGSVSVTDQISGATV